MDGRKCCERGCDEHNVQRSLYRHALNALVLASRSGCRSAGPGSNEVADLLEQHAKMLRDSHRSEERAAVGADV
jgi:hypothetical protein